MRSLPARPSLRHLKLEAKRRLAAGEFATLHDAQAAIAREHGLPSWARLKQSCAPDSQALIHLRWIVDRFSGADRPGWTPPGEDELRQHFDDRFLAAIPARGLIEAIARMAAELRTGLVVIRQAPLEAQPRPGSPDLRRSHQPRGHRRVPRRRPPAHLARRLITPRKKETMYQPYPGSETQLPESQRGPAPATVRNAVTALFGVATLDTIIGLTAPLAGPVKLWGLLVWLAGLVAVVFLWRPASTAYFRQVPA